jgi:hypothetical protein
MKVYKVQNIFLVTAVLLFTNTFTNIYADGTSPTDQRMDWSFGFLQEV